MGFPLGDGHPVLIDYATTTIAGSKVTAFRDKNEPLPPNSVVDKDGNPTTDANACLDGGSHLPFGAHKGYALMLAVEFFGRILSGADAFAGEGGGGPIFRRSGVAMMVVKADLFQPLTDYVMGAEDLANHTRAVPPAPGFDEVLIPGDLEARTRAIRKRDGIPISDALWQRLLAMADSLGLNIN